jgi:hypothetical protein
MAPQAANLVGVDSPYSHHRGFKVAPGAGLAAVVQVLAFVSVEMDVPVESHVRSYGQGETDTPLVN